jgi:uncharacterized protein
MGDVRASDARLASRSIRLQIGIISDTHGLLRPEALAVLAGSDWIVHAGDVGDPAILDRLGEIATLTVVRGNIDQEPWAEPLPESEMFSVGGVRIDVVHDRGQLVIDPLEVGIRVVIFGHSHIPLIEEDRGVLYINPGSAGPRRFSLPVTVARLFVEGGEAQAEIVELFPGRAT